MVKYRTIVADPPWDMGRQGSWRESFGHVEPHWGVRAELPYSSMELKEIAALPVGEMADENAHLYLWTVNRYVEAAYATARAWGFEPRQLLTWAKTPMGLGPGGSYAQTSEHIIFGKRGSLADLSRASSSWFNWPRPRVYGACHSNKPDAFLDLVEQVSPGPYLELFARRNRLGWDTWGNESLEHVSLEAVES